MCMPMFKDALRIFGLLLLVNGILACSSTPQNGNALWHSGDYSMQLSEAGLDLLHRGQPFARIHSFEFNFIHADFDQVLAVTDQQLLLRLQLDQTDGFHNEFPQHVELSITHTDGRFHFAADHPSFLHIGINLVDRNEHYFGLLEKLYPDNRKSPDLRGATVDVDVYHQGERDFAENYASAYSAFYISSAGYGSFFDTFAKGQYRFAQQGLTRIYHQTDQLDWYIFHGPDGKHIHQRYFQVIGEPKSIPIWALGPVVWRDHNTGKDEVLDDLTRFAELKIPLTATFVDRPYSDGGHQWSKMNFAEAFANPEQWIGKINNEFGMEVMSWVGPMTFGDEDFPGLLPNHRTYIDLTHPQALAEFERRLQTQQYSAGIKGHKMDRADENFPFTAFWHQRVPESETRNTYVYLYAKVIDQFLRNAHGEDQFNFARAAYHRSQPFLSAVWGGDVRPNWTGMASNQANAMRTAFMGFPVWGSDTGGYLGDGYIDEKLYARWLQWGAWNGMFEIKLDGIGGQGEDRAPWQYGERLQHVFRQAAEQRIALIPYSYSLANTSAQNGVLMKPMAYVYPEDANTHAMWDQYLFGDAFLVAPLFGPEDERDIYLPAGTWYDFNNITRRYQGGQTISQRYAFDKMPVFIKANSIYVTGDIYRGSAKRWRGEVDGKHSLTFHAFPGSKGEDTHFDYVDYLQDSELKTYRLVREEDIITFSGPVLNIDSQLHLRLDHLPKQLEVNGQPLAIDYRPETQLLVLALPKNQKLVVSVEL